MTEETDKKILLLQNMKKKLILFFPEDAYSFTNQAIENGLDDGDFMAKPATILPYVQTALFDDKVLEIEIDGLTRTYFSRLYDDIPDLEEVAEDENGDPIFQEPEYIAGDYLKLLTHIICLPVEPAMGNLQVRNSQRITLRFFTSTTAIELGTFFQNLTTVRGLPVLRLAFPVIGRQVRGTRAFRAKVTLKMDLTLFIKGKEQRPDIRTNPIDISANGISFEIQKEEQKLFTEGDTCSIKFIVDGDTLTKVNGTIRHTSKIRAKKGIQYNCGVQFDLPTRVLAATVETLVATVQRVHLQELSDKSAKTGITLIK